MSTTSHLFDPDYSVENYPDVTILRQERRRAAFRHSCSICGGDIAQGELHRYYFIRDNDAIPRSAFTSRQHLCCPQDTSDPVSTGGTDA